MKQLTAEQIEQRAKEKYPRQHRFEIKYRLLNGKVRYCRVDNVAEKDKRLDWIEDYGYQFLSCKKLYPVNTSRYRRQFLTIASVCENKVAWILKNHADYDSPLNTERIRKLKYIQQKATEYAGAEYPVAWVPHETYEDMHKILKLLKEKKKGLAA